MGNGLVDTVTEELKSSHVIRDTFKGLFKHWQTVLLVILWTAACLGFGYFVGSDTTSAEDTVTEEASE